MRRSEAVVRDLQDKADKAGVALSLTGGPAPVSTIPQIVQSIMFNLCDNAVKYNNHEGGHVAVDACRSGADVVLTVTGDGIGIPAGEQERIFERFYRVDKSRSKATGGTGLGLFYRQARRPGPGGGDRSYKRGREEHDRHGAFSAAKPRLTEK